MNEFAARCNTVLVFVTETTTIDTFDRSYHIHEESSYYKTDIMIAVLQVYLESVTVYGMRLSSMFFFLQLNSN